MRDSLFDFKISPHFRADLKYGFCNPQFKHPLLVLWGVMKCDLMTLSLHYEKISFGSTFLLFFIILSLTQAKVLLVPLPNHAKSDGHSFT